MSNSKKKCPYCKELIDDEAEKCPRCHSDLMSWAESNRKNKRGEWLGGLVVIVIIIVLIGKCNGDDEKKSSNTNTQTEQVTENKISYSDNNEEKIAAHSTTKQTSNRIKETSTTEQTDNKTNSEEFAKSIEIEVNKDLSETKILDFETFKQLAEDIRKTDFDKIKKDKKSIIQKVASFKNNSDYESVIIFVIENNKELGKKWQKEGPFFENQIEFYEAFVSGEYKEILKSRKQ